LSEGVSIIIPAYNEEKSIKNVIKDIKKYAKRIKGKVEIIVVDDGSNDSTLNIIKKMYGIKIVRHMINKGKGATLKTAFNNSKGKILLTIDSDCTYPADMIPDLIKTIKNEEVDIVIGSRFLGKTISMSRLNYFGNMFFSTLITILTGKGVTDASSGMRAFNKKLLSQLNIKANGLEWEVEMTTKSLKKGLKIQEVPITYNERMGKSKLKPFGDGFRFLITILRSRFL